MKFKKDAAKIRKALPALTADQIHAFLESGKVTVEGHELLAEDLRVNRGLKQDPATANYEPAIDGQVMVLLDSFAYPELAQEGLMREVLNRVQRLRKRAGLVPTDDVKLAYTVLASSSAATADGEAAKEKSSDEAAAAEGVRLEHERVIEEMFAQQAAAFTKAASKGVVKDDGSPAVAEEETDVKDVRLLLKLLKV